MKPLLFIDFDGTLCHDRFWRSLKADEMEKVQQCLFVGNKEMVWDWMMGKYSAEEVTEFLSHETGIPYDYLWHVFVKDCQTMHVSGEVLEQIKKLREKYEVVLSTDNMDSFARFTVPALSLNTYFDQIIDSYTMKKSKNEFFGELFENASTEKSTYVLIDNSQNTCNLFSVLGGKAYLATKQEPLSHWLATL